MAALSSQLGFLAQRNLSAILDFDSSHQRNWVGLASQMGFPYETVLRLREERKGSPTLALLEEWQKKVGDKAATLDALVGLLDSLGCKEAIDIVRKAQASKQASKSPDQGGVAQFVSRASDGEDNLKNTNPVKTQRFDVFLSYAEEDEEFAEQMRSRLINDLNLRVFIPSQGFMMGKVFHQEIANTIKEDCRRTVVILSSSYLSSPWCNYEANLAIMMSPDCKKHSLVPVLYKKCDVPPFLSHLYCLDYSRYRENKEKCERLFWKKLYQSLTFVVP